MPWQPAPISQSIWGPTSLRSISPPWVNGVVIGGITPVGRIFMAALAFIPLTRFVDRPVGRTLPNVIPAIHLLRCMAAREGCGTNVDNEEQADRNAARVRPLGRSDRLLDAP